MMEINFVIDGEPFGKERPRHNKFRTYTPNKTKDKEEEIALRYKQIFGNQRFTDEQEIEIYVKAYMKIPKSTSKVKSNKMLSGVIRPTKKPDWDNIGKLVSDALNGVAFGDDKQIVKAVVEKHYTNEPRTEVTIRSIE